MPRNGRAAAQVAALLSIPLLAACASADGLSSEDLLSQGRVVNESRPGAARAALEERGSAEAAAAAADRAEAQLAAGEPVEALETVRVALLLLPPEPEAGRLRDLRMRAKRAFVRDSVAKAVVEAPEAETEGWPLRVRVSLRNVAAMPLVVEEPPPGANPATVRLRVVRTAYDVMGNVRIEEWEELQPFPPGTAPPGGSHSVEVVVGTERFRRLVPHGFVTYDFRGEVLISATRLGQVDLADRIPLTEARTTTFPQRGWREVAADPEAHLDRGFREGNPVRVLLAAACLPEGARASAAAGLARRLREEGPLAPALESGVRAALRFLAGDRDADRWTADRWEEWAAAPGEGGP